MANDANNDANEADDDANNIRVGDYVEKKLFFT